MINSFQGEHEFLSNFAASEIEFEGIVFPTVEHAFQAAKTFNHTGRVLIAAASTPGKAKRLGRSVSLRADWDEVKYSIMFQLVLQKFQLPALEEKLLATGDAILVEGNTWGDKVWGVCDGEGTNWLGQILMDVRKRIKKEKEERMNKDVLVVIDVQNDFVYGVLGSDAAKAIVPNVVNKIKEFDTKNIYYTRDTHTEDYLNTQEGKNLPILHCVKYTKGWEIIDDIVNTSGIVFPA